MANLEDVSIDGVAYPCNIWQSVEAGRVAKEEWIRGFDGGMAEFRRRSATGTFLPSGVDVEASPFVRLPRTNTTTTITGADTSTVHPMYGFYIESGTSGNEYVYILKHRYGWKIDLDDTNAVENRKDFGASAVCGRPTLFDNAWYIPLGQSVNAVKLTAANCADTGADTFTDLGYNADHFATIEDEGVSKLAVASTNTVGYSADGTAPPSTFEVGDSSLNITDLLTWKGELLVVKPNGPWTLDQNGNAHRIQDFVDLGRKSLTPKKSGATYSYEGSNSFVLGPYAFWVDATGLWRILGESIYPVGFDATPAFVNFRPDNEDLLAENDSWWSFTAWGLYCYATTTRGIASGVVQRDGTIHWSGYISHGFGGSGNAEVNRVVITEGKNGPILWRNYEATLNAWNLNQSGSMREELGDSRISASGTIYLPFVAFGDLSQQNQLRRQWILADGLDADNTIQLKVLRDRAAASANVGNAITASGFAEVTWTPGTADLCYEAMAVAVLTSDGSGDPRISAWGIEAATASVYRCEIPLTAEDLAGRGISVADALKNLRDLKNSKGIAVSEPDFNATWTGYIRSIGEETVKDKHGQRGHTLTVFIERYDWTDNA